MQDTETGQRGYLLTGNEAYLEPYQRALPTIERRLARIAELTADNREQQLAVARLRPLIAEKMAFTLRTIDMRRAGQGEAATRLLSMGTGRRLMDRIRTQLAAMTTTEDQLLQLREQRAVLSSRLLLASISVGCLLSLFFAGVWLRDNARNVRRVLAATSDIQAVGAQLAESEARFRTLVDGIPQLAWMARKDGQIFWYNRRWLDYTGASLEDMQGTGWRLVQHPDHVERVARRIQQSWDTGEAWEDTFPLRGRDGAYRWFLSRAEPIRDASGEIALWFGTNTDISEARTVAAALAASEASLLDANALMRTFIDAVPGVVYAKDTEGRLLVANKGVAELVGKPAYAILGRTDDQFLSDKAQADIIMANDRRIMSTGVAEQVEEIVNLIDGTPSIWLSTKVPLRNAAGDITGVIGTSVDITARKQAEAVLARDKAELERLVDERTQSLRDTQTRLAHTQRLEALGQLTGGVAHDFNNLLTAILGSLRLLSERLPPLDERGERLMKNAIQGAERGATLTQRLLAFGRRALLTAEAVDVAALIDGMSELLRSSLGTGVDVVLSVPADLPPIFVDLSQLELAILNLAVNARDAMGGSGVLTISARTEHAGPQDGLAPGDYVAITVADTGEGMDEATLARAVEPFFTTKDVGKGTGLGLSMVHGLAGQSGGKLTLSSRPGEGTSVDMWFPQAGRRLAPVAADETPSASPSLSRRCTLLLVDDDLLVLATCAAILEDCGHAVLETASARQALELLEAGARIDLVLTDYSMPEMSGPELATEVARIRPGLPVVMMTGHTERTETAFAGLPLLTKPLDRAGLERTIAANYIRSASD